MLQYTYSSKSRMAYAWFFAMHTRVDFLLCDVDKTQGLALCEELRILVLFWEKIASRFDVESELYALNCKLQDSVGKFCLSSDLSEILNKALFYRTKTLGLFDVMYRSVPYEGDEEADVNINDRELVANRLGVSFDLSGFAKGFALDKCVSFLQERGIKNALLNIGNSSIFGLGAHPCGQAWPVSPACCLRDDLVYYLNNESLTTSGHPEGALPHVVCPHTGECVKDKLYASVVTDSATEGEAFSTALFVSGSRLQVDQLSIQVKRFKIMF